MPNQNVKEIHLALLFNIQFSYNLILYHSNKMIGTASCLSSIMVTLPLSPLVIHTPLWVLYSLQLFKLFWFFFFFFGLCDAVFGGVLFSVLAMCRDKCCVLHKNPTLLMHYAEPECKRSQLNNHRLRRMARLMCCR